MFYRAAIFTALICLGGAFAIPAHAAMSGTSDAVAQRAAAAPKIVRTSLPAAPAQAAGPEPFIRMFDGHWNVRTSPGCVTLTRSSFTVSRGRVSGPLTSGQVDANGNVRSVGRFGFLTTVSTGRVNERTGSGTYRQSDGCTGTWTAQKR